MPIKMMYDITFFILNVFQYQMANFNNTKLQLLLHQPNDRKLSFYFIFK